MITFLIALICLLLFIILGIIVWLLFGGKKDTRISSQIISCGLGLIASSFLCGYEVLLLFVANCLSVESPVDQSTDFIQLMFGCILVVVGIVLRRSVLKRVYVLNIPGMMRKEIGEPKTEKDLGLIGYQVKEMVLDITWAQEDIMCITDQLWERAKTHIEYFVGAFSAKDDVKCFTGMAPIPFEMYAGTCHTGKAIERFFEYDRFAGKYVELRRNRFKFFPIKRYDKLIVPEIIDTSASDVLVVFSTTTEISDLSIVQFEGMKTYRVGIQKPRNNAISSRNQLEEYVSQLSEILEQISSKTRSIATIHLVCSTQSCFAYSLGVELSHMKNRVVEVVSYHYVAGQITKYPIGIVVNGDRRGELLHAN